MSSMLYKLAKQYHTECETYDLTVCSCTKSMPATPIQLSSVNKNAVSVLTRLTARAFEIGSSKQQLIEAIQIFQDTI